MHHISVSKLRLEVKSAQDVVPSQRFSSRIPLVLPVGNQGESEGIRKAIQAEFHRETGDFKVKPTDDEKRRI